MELGDCVFVVVTVLNEERPYLRNGVMCIQCVLVHCAKKFQDNKLEMQVIEINRKDSTATAHKESDRKDEENDNKNSKQYARTFLNSLQA